MFLYYYCSSIFKGPVKPLGLLDPFCHLVLGRFLPDETGIGHVEPLDGLPEVVGVPLGQLRDVVHADLLEKVRPLLADALDPHEVGEVGPLEDQVLADTGRLRELFPHVRRSCPLEQLLSGVDVEFSQPIFVLRANALDFKNWVVQVNAPDCYWNSYLIN